MAASYPGTLLAAGITDLGRFDPFNLFAGESDIVTDQGQAADNTAIAFGEVLTRDANGRIVPWTAAGDYATGALTFTVGQPTNGQTVTINGNAITFVTSGATGQQVNLGTAAVMTQSLKDLINLSPALYGVHAVAAAAATVVSLTAIAQGTAGNALTLAISGTYPSVSGATLTDVAGTETVPFANAIGIAAQPVPSTATGPFLPYYTGGVFNHEALIWPAGVASLAQRKAAFDGTNIGVRQLL